MIWAGCRWERSRGVDGDIYGIGSAGIVRGSVEAGRRKWQEAFVLENSGSKGVNAQGGDT